MGVGIVDQREVRPKDATLPRTPFAPGSRKHIGLGNFASRLKQGCLFLSQSNFLNLSTTNSSNNFPVSEESLPKITYLQLKIH